MFRSVSVSFATFSISLLALLLFSCAQNGKGQAGGSIQTISPLIFKNKLDSIAEKHIIDVRTPEEYKKGYIKGAINLNIYNSDFENNILLLEKNKPVFVYCRSGARSKDASGIMSKMGFAQIYNLQGGILSWQNYKLPVCTN